MARVMEGGLGSGLIPDTTIRQFPYGKAAAPARSCEVLQTSHNRCNLDPKQIDLSDTDACRYWAGRFGVSREELWMAVRKVGSRAIDVEHLLGEREPTNDHMHNDGVSALAGFAPFATSPLLTSGGMFILHAGIA